MDSCVLIDIFKDDPKWAAWSAETLHEQRKTHTLWINPIIFTEISVDFDDCDLLIDTLTNTLGLELKELPYKALFATGKAFLKYRKNGGNRRSAMPDFYIGAHATVLSCPVITRDIARFKSYFPKVSLIAPT